MRMIVRDARGKERGHSQDASENEEAKKKIFLYCFFLCSIKIDSVAVMKNSILYLMNLFVKQF